MSDHPASPVALAAEGLLARQMAYALLEALADRLGGSFAVDVAGRLALRGERIRQNGDADSLWIADLITRDLEESPTWARAGALPG